jgi:hypothetical protein
LSWSAETSDITSWAPNWWSGIAFAKIEDEEIRNK